VHREGLRLPCLQRELPTQLPLLQSYLLRLCSQMWLPKHPSRLHRYLLMPCGLQKPLPQRSSPHLHHCSIFEEWGQMMLRPVMGRPGAALMRPRPHVCFRFLPPHAAQEVGRGMRREKRQVEVCCESRLARALWKSHSAE
jgi:hypothetical protein